MKEILQAYIYNEKMLNDLYKRAAALTCREDEKQALLNFADHCHQMCIRDRSYPSYNHNEDNTYKHKSLDEAFEFLLYNQHYK